MHPKPSKSLDISRHQARIPCRCNRKKKRDILWSDRQEKAGKIGCRYTCASINITCVRARFWRDARPGLDEWFCIVASDGSITPCCRRRAACWLWVDDEEGAVVAGRHTLSSRSPRADGLGSMPSTIATAMPKDRRRTSLAVWSRSSLNPMDRIVAAVDAKSALFSLNKS